jgi:hypothetical protein
MAYDLPPIALSPQPPILRPPPFAVSLSKGLHRAANDWRSLAAVRPELVEGSPELDEGPVLSLTKGLS